MSGNSSTQRPLCRISAESDLTIPHGTVIRRTYAGKLQRSTDVSDRPVAIDLFSGAGGLSYGLEAAGYHVALAVDFNDWALETHAHNFDGEALHLDLSRLDVQDDIVNSFRGVDVALIAGGPPCQPFSRVGRSKIRSLVDSGVRDPNDQRSHLWEAFFNIVERIRPRAVLMENVPDIVTSDNMIILRKMLGRLDRAGYDSYVRIVNAWEYGVPQHRKRFILVGLRDGGEFVWPAPVGVATVRDAIDDLPVLDPALGDVGAVVMPYGGAHSDFQRQARKCCSGEDGNFIFDHITRPVRSDDLEAFRLMKPGMPYSQLPEELRRYRSDIFHDRYNRLEWDGLSRTITAHIGKDGYMYIHPDQHRTLTVREAARIQTFPDHFRFAGARSHQFAQIGNAVPPTVGEVIGGAVLEATRDVASRRVSRKRGWLESIKRCLIDWGQVDKNTAVWAYPSDPWVVLIGLLFGSRSNTGILNPAEVLDLVPTLDDATPQMLDVLDGVECVGWRHASVQRLRDIVNSFHENSDSLDREEWLELSGLRGSARRWLEILAFDGNEIVASQGVRRVVSRIMGVDGGASGVESDIMVAEIVGDKKDSVFLNATIQRLCERVCLRVPRCSDCPIKATCKSVAQC